MNCQQQVIQDIFGQGFNVTQSVLKDRSFKIRNINDRNHNNYCALIIIYDDELKIEQIYNCISLSGTKIIQNIINIAERLDITNIYLDDGSVINGEVINGIGACHFYIYVLSILKNGRSWYNKLGFISDNYENEILQNYRLHSMKVIDIINECLSLEQCNNLKNDKLIYLNKKSIWFNRNVKELIEYFVKKLTPSTYINCKDDEIVWLIHFLEIAQNIIQYNSNLEYKPIERDALELKHNVHFSDVSDMNISISGGKKIINKYKKRKQTTNANKRKHKQKNNYKKTKKNNVKKKKL